MEKIITDTLEIFESMQSPVRDADYVSFMRQLATEAVSRAVACENRLASEALEEKRKKFSASIRIIDGKERQCAIDINLDGDDSELLNVFGLPSEEYGTILFFQNKDGFFHTDVCRDSIHTQDLAEVINFLVEYA